MKPFASATPAATRKRFKDFLAHDHPDYILAGVSALKGEPFPSLRKSTDWYVGNLAATHGMK